MVMKIQASERKGVRGVQETCEDTTSRFEVTELGGKTKKKGCDWVAEMRTSWRCDLVGVREQCPATCGGCGDDCADKAGKYTITIGTFTGDKKACKWVAQRPRVRCKDPAAQEHCPASCGLCPSTEPTPGPTASTVTAGPTPTISSSPSSMPSGEYDWCVDSTEKFELPSISYIHTKKDCGWVESKNWFHCSIPEVIENCPKTCEKCSCVNNPDRFEVNGQLKNCNWAGTKSGWRCSNIEEVTRNCPLLCGVCDM